VIDLLEDDIGSLGESTGSQVSTVKVTNIEDQLHPGLKSAELNRKITRRRAPVQLNEINKFIKKK